MALNHAMIWVNDVARAQRFYIALGARVINDVGHYSRLAFSNGNSLSLHHGEAKPGTTTLYFDLPVDATCTALIERDYRCTLQPTDQVWNWREAHFADPDGYPVVIYQDSPANRRVR